MGRSGRCWWVLWLGVALWLGGGLAHAQAPAEPAAATWDAVVDLSGPWRYQLGDDPAFASPDLDDRAWPSVSLPEVAGFKTGRPEGESIWLRRTVALPPGPAPAMLGLGLGQSNGAQEVFINGVKVGGAGKIVPFEPAMYLASFTVIPAPAVGSEGRALIAVRFRSEPAIGRLRGRTTFRLGDGPYLLGPAATVEPMVRLTIEKERLRVASSMGAPSLLFLLVGAIFFYLYRLRPVLREHLWFSLFLFAGSLPQLMAVRMLTPAAAWAPFSTHVRVSVSLSCLMNILFVELMCRVLLGRAPGRLGRGLQVGLGALGLGLAATATGTAQFFAWGLNVPLMAAPLPVVLVMATGAVWRGQRDAWLLLVGLLGFAGMLGLSVYLITYHVTLYRVLPVAPAHLGSLVLVASMAALLVRRFVRDIERGETEVRSLNLDLQDHVARLEEQKGSLDALNTELRRQIALRSRQLSEALARIGAVPERHHALSAGDRVEDRFQVLRPLGEGGMGAVYEVERLQDRAHFALKILRGARKGEQLARFAREAQIAAQVDHPNVVAVRDVDVASSGALFVVMDLVRGTSLEDLHERFGDVGWAVPLLRQIAAGLSALHAAGVTHRDLKPANVMVDELGKARIADFGISALSDAPSSAPTNDDAPALASTNDAAPALAPTNAATPALAPTIDAGAMLGHTVNAALALGATIDAAQAFGPTVDAAQALGATVGADQAPGAAVKAGPEGRESARLTRAGVWMGTPAYMAPELARGATEASWASDMWAFGVMACEMMTGQAPFDAPPLFGAMAGLATPDPRIALAGPLRELVAGCLATEPSRRPTADIVGASLASLGPIHSTSADTLGG